MKVVVALVALVAMATPVAAQTVTTGDKINLNGTTYRLWGIDAPESKQWCGEYPAGLIATAMLEMLVKSKTVVCEPKTIDGHGRTVALCRADGEDLGRTMVQLGMAWAPSATAATTSTRRHGHGPRTLAYIRRNARRHGSSGRSIDKGAG
jgi:endonuclease YncB( thermonuclease family)